MAGRAGARLLLRAPPLLGVQVAHERGLRDRVERLAGGRAEPLEPHRQGRRQAKPELGVETDHGLAGRLLCHQPAASAVSQITSFSTAPTAAAEPANDAAMAAAAAPPFATALATALGWTPSCRAT